MNLNKIKILMNLLTTVVGEPDHYDKGFEILEKKPFDSFMTSLKSFVNMEKLNDKEVEAYIRGIKHGIAFSYASEHEFLDNLLQHMKEIREQK
jgi:hypothetical protein